MAAPEVLWRVFPWDDSAEPGQPHSPSFVPQPTGRGRFDLPRRDSSVLYLAESPDHAVGEFLQAWRGGVLSEAELRVDGVSLATVPVQVSDEGRGRVADLCAPELLASLSIAPDRVASRDRSITQPIGKAIWERGHSGLRWWSSFWGDWHTVVLFSARVGDALTFARPERLTLDSPPVREAAKLLGMRIA